MLTFFLLMKINYNIYYTYISKKKKIFLNDDVQQFQILPMGLTQQIEKIPEGEAQIIQKYLHVNIANNQFFKVSLMSVLMSFYVISVFFHVQIMVVMYNLLKLIVTII